MFCRHTAALLVIVVASSSVGAQSVPNALHRLTTLDPKSRDEVERGEAIAITLESPDKNEIAMLGVVRLEVPRAFYVDHVKQLTGFLVSSSGSSSGTFGEPAKVEDMAALSLDPSDAKALQKCQPLKCDVKLPAGEMERFRRELASSHDPLPRADSLMREWLVSYVNAYRADSGEETVVYDDTKKPVRSSDAFRALISEPVPPGIDGDRFGSMLSLSRAARPPEVASRISWEIDRMPGLKPILEVVERSTYASPAHPDECWMSTKLLYASHYFESQVDFLTVSDAPPSGSQAASYLVVLRRQRFDDLPSGGLFNIRGKAVKKLRESLRGTLANTRLAIAQAYTEALTPAPRAP